MPKTATLSPIVQAILDYIRQYRAIHPYGPTQDDIAQAIGKSRSTVKTHLKVLEAVGKIERDPYLKQTLRVKYDKK